MIRSIALYAALVGVPLVGVSAVLHIGQNLTTSPSFGGSWRLEVNPGPGCDPVVERPVTLLIEQSGPALTVRGWGESLRGRVIGEGFVVGDSVRRIEAQRTGGRNGDRFEGTAHGIPCPVAATPVRATRLSLPRNLTGH